MDDDSGSASDRINRATWSRPDTLADYRDLHAWTDVAERQALLRLAPEVRGRPILDVGAGAGRTTSFLRLLSDDYVAVDYTPEMVELFRRNHPGVEVQHADARDLSRFATARFSLAVFSFNGIDAVDHVGRLQALAELRRVTAPDGRLLLSTHNQDGPGPRRRPWRGRPGSGPPWRRAVRVAIRLPQNLRRHAREHRAWLRNRGEEHEAAGWSLQMSPAHGFTVLMHYTTLEQLQRELADAGFVDVEVYAREDGRRVEAGDDVSGVLWFQVVARVP